MLLNSIVFSNSALAITAKDLTERMNEDRRFGYLSGLVDMLSYKAVLDGDRAQGRCIIDAFYRDNTMQKRIIDALLSFPDREPVAILIVVMNKTCKT